jgi:1-acylglycerone phosphate reductase
LYNATKASVNLLSKQLRIELAPFDVTAINVTTGVIKTKFFDNMHGTKLPANSLYTPAKDIIEPAMDGDGIEERWTEVEPYAAAVVKNALKSNPNKDLWVGGNTFNIWLLDSFGWSSIWVSFSSSIWDLNSNLDIGLCHSEYVQDSTGHEEDTGCCEI